MLFFTPAALAAEGDEPLAVQAARRHFDSGIVFYEKGDYEAARIEFEAAHRLTKHPDLLVNLCVVAEKQNRIEEAVNYCQQYLKATPGAKDASEVAGRVERLQRQLAEPAARSTPVPQPAAPAAVPPASASPAPDAPPAPGRETRRSSYAGPIALASAGGALLITGIALGGAALATSREIEQGPVFAMVDSLRQKGQALDASAIAFDVIGGVATVAGVTWLAVEWKRRPAR